MKVQLINLPLADSLDDRMDLPLGLLYIATFLRAHGYDAQVTDLTSVPESEWMQRIPPADVYGMTIYTPTYSTALRLARKLRAINPAARYIAGGPHPSALPQEVNNVFDFVIVGEGEAAMLALVETLVHRRPYPRLVAGRPISDLDALPYPDLNLVDVSSYNRIVDGRPSVAVITSRGCLWSCAYCYIGASSKRTLRFRSPENVIGEIDAIIQQRNMRHFIFHDDAFTVNRKRLFTLCKELEPLGIRFRANSIVNRNKPEDFEVLYRAGCRTIAFGVESASERVLSGLFQKPITQAMIRDAIGNAQQAGLRVRVYLLVGFPGQTMADIRETAEFMHAHPPDEWCVFTFVPYPGTAVWNDPAKYQATITGNFDEFVFLKGHQEGGLSVATPQMSHADVVEQRHYLTSRLQELPWRGDRQLYHREESWCH